MSKTRYYYTSVTPKSVQSSPSRSLGGYISVNSVYSTGTITENVSVESSLIPVNAEIETSGYAHVNTEIFKFSDYDSGLVVSKRGVGSGVYPHLSGDIINYIKVADLFDEKSSTLTQYRCLAVKNLTYEAMGDVEIVVLQSKNNNTLIEVGIEVPKHNNINGEISTLTSDKMVNNSSWASLYPDEHFTNSVFRLTSGSAIGNYAVIESYDSSGVIVLEDSITGMSPGDKYVIETAPSQSVVNGDKSPEINSLFSGFSRSQSNLLKVNGTGLLKSEEIMYVWIKKTLQENKKSSSEVGSTLLLKHVNANEQIMITEVLHLGGNSFKVTFSGNILVVNTQDLNFRLQVWDVGENNLEWTQPLNITQINDTEFTCATGGDADTSVGDYEITNKLTAVIGINGDIAYPQTGAINPGGG